MRPPSRSCLWIAGREFAGVGGRRRGSGGRARAPGATYGRSRTVELTPLAEVDQKLTMPETDRTEGGSGEEDQKTVKLQAFSMELSGALSNQDLQERLRRVVGKLADVRAKGEVRECRSCRQRSRRPGWVVKAVVKVLADRQEPMRAKEIHAAVESLIGEPVGWSSVKQALASHVDGPSARFVRIARGRYMLA